MAVKEKKVELIELFYDLIYVYAISRLTMLIEEPENHLSPVNLRKLVQRVASTKQGQLFITTHSSMISTRLEINNLLIMDNNSCGGPIKLSDLKDETAKYFAKTPPASIVEYALATKAILVEGPAEYMLMDKFYRTITGISPEEDDVHVIDVRGLSFKRYLEIAKLTGSKVAVITDNDKDYEKHCVAKYKDYKDNKKYIKLSFIHVILLINIFNNQKL